MKNINRLISLLLCAMLLFAATACSAPAQTQPEATAEPTAEPAATEVPTDEPEASAEEGLSFTPGTYTGTAAGRNGPLEVKVVVDETSIQSVEVTGHKETATLSDTPCREIPKQIVQYQTLDIDAVTGATLTSYAISRAVANALESATESDLYVKVEKEVPANTDTTTDIVVVGAGSAGMTAAIRAAEAGAKVLLVEKQGFLGGGDSMFSSTSIRAGGSQLQPEEDQSADAFYEYLEAAALKYRADVCDLDAVRLYADRSGAIVDWLMELGVPYGNVVKPSFSIKIGDGSAPGTHNIKALANRIEELGIEYRVNTKATEILMDNGTAVGVHVVDKGGEYDIHAKATIITTGGYSNNTDLVAKYAPQWLNRPTTGAPSCTGDGILMAEAIGAKITNMDQVKANALCYVKDGVGISLTAITSYSVLVNHNGERFMDENAGTVVGRATELMKQPDHEAYAIFDQTTIDELALIAGYNESGYFMTANTLEELADQLDVDKETFLATMEAYNTEAAASTEAAYEGDSREVLTDAPYYAALVTPSMQSSYGGITVDHECHVLDVNDNIIPGLYAAGATSGHSCCAGEVGAALIVCFVFGEIAGQTACAELN